MYELSEIHGKIHEVRGISVMLEQLEVTNCDHIPKKLKHSYILPLAFTEHGVTMLSSVLRSDVAIDASILVVRAFVAMRQLILNPPIDRVGELQNEIKELKQYVEEVFTDYNEINEDTRIQLEFINESLAELQAKKKELEKPRMQIGFGAPKYR